IPGTAVPARDSAHRRAPRTDWYRLPPCRARSLLSPTCRARCAVPGGIWMTRSLLVFTCSTLLLACGGDDDGGATADAAAADAASSGGTPDATAAPPDATPAMMVTCEAGNPCDCPPGETCTIDCPGGGCDPTCAEGATCTIDCTAGDCN